MKLTICLLLLFFGGVLLVNVYAQTDIKFPGIIAIHNSQYKTGTKEYVAFATVTSTGKCIPTSSNSDGKFTLVFSDKPAGDAATIFVNKEGFEVVNTKDLEEATIIGRLTPLKVFMCKKGELEANKKSYYLISDSAIQKIYEKRLNALLQNQGKEYNSVIASLKKELNRNIKDADEAIAALNEQLQSQKKQLKELVTQFAIENLDDQSETYQQAFTAFTKGNIDEALAILDKVDLKKRLEKNAEQIEKAKSAIDVLNENIELKKDQMHQDVEQALLDARMHKLKYQFDETEASYDLVVEYDSTNFSYLREYFEFLSDIKNYQKIIKVLNEALRIFKNLKPEDSYTNWDIAKIEMFLGVTYMGMEDYSHAEEAHRECIRLENELVKKNPTYYEPKIAGEKLLLGMIYSGQGDTANAEALYTEALKVQERLAKKNPYYLSDVAQTKNSLGVLYSEINPDKAKLFYEDALKILTGPAKGDKESLVLVQQNLGNLYKKKKEFEKAEVFYKDAIDIYTSFAKTDPLKYKHNLASVQADLADSYYKKGDYLNAEKFYLQALEVYDNLVNSNASGFEENVANTKSDLGIVYKKLKKYTKAETLYLDALQLYRKLSVRNPKKFKPEVARMQNNLGSLYTDMNEYEKAEASYFPALDIRKLLAKTDSAAEKDLAITLRDLGTLYRKKKEFAKAESFYFESLGINNRLSKRNSEQFEPEIAGTENDLGVMYHNQKDFAKTEDAYLKSLKIYEKLAQKEPNTYQDDVARMQNNLGLTYSDENEFSKSEAAFLHALKIREQLSLKDPLAYEKDFFETQSSLANLYQDMVDSLKNGAVKSKYRELIISFYERLDKKLLKETRLSNVRSGVCGNLSWHLLFIKNFKEAEMAAHWGLQIDSSEIWIRTNLAHALLFQDRYAEAEKEYLNLKEIKDSANGKLYKTIFIEDLDYLEKNGITHTDIKKIRAQLSQ